MAKLRTADKYFENLPGFPYQPHYFEHNGMRVHYMDEGEGEVVLCMHGEPSWCYLYRKFIPVLVPGYRVMSMDFIGFGRSDKYTKTSDYTYQMHLETIFAFLEHTGIKNITLVVQDWGGLLGLGALGQKPDLFARVVIMNTTLPVGSKSIPLAFKAWKAFSQYSPAFPIGGIIKMGTYQPMDEEVKAAYDAPFPNSSYKAGARAFPALVPSTADDPGVAEMFHAREVLKEWQKPALVMFSDKDPIMKGADKWFRANIPTANNEPFIEIKDAGHFLQEDKGVEIAGHIKEFMQRRPL